MKLSPDYDTCRYYNSTHCFVDGYFGMILEELKSSEKYYTNLDPTRYKQKRVYKRMNDCLNYWKIAPY